MFDVGRSMFDVQSVHCSGQADFHTREEGAVNPDDYDNYLSIVNQLRSLITYFFPNLLGICFRVEIMRSFF